MLKDRIIFVATTRFMAFFDKDLTEITRLPINQCLKYTSIFEIQHLTSCTPSLEENQFVYAIKATGKGEHYILKGGLAVGPSGSSDQCKRVFRTPDTINTVLEYAINKFVVQLLPEVDQKASILVIDGIKTMQKIHDPNQMNEEKNLLLLLPDFKENEFPMIVSTGSQTLNLINLSTGRTQVLIDAPIYGVGPQQTVFFQDEDYGFSLVFATRKYDKEGDLEFGWHKMPIKKDMKRLLTEYGQLPFSDPEEALKEMAKKDQKIRELEKRIKELDSQNKRTGRLIQLEQYDSDGEEQFGSF